MNVGVSEKSEVSTPSFQPGSRVVMLLESLEGPDAAQALILANFLAQKKAAHVEVWIDKDADAPEPGHYHEQIVVRRVKRPLPWAHSRLTQAARLIRFAGDLKRARPNMILPYGLFNSIAVGIIWRLTGAQTYIWNQGYDTAERLGGRPEKMAVGKTPAFVGNCEHALRFLTGELGVPANKAHLIHNAVALNAAPSDGTAWRQAHQIPEHSFVALALAEQEKDPDYAMLFTAWRMVRSKLRDGKREALLLMASRDEENYRLQKAAAFDAELYDGVVFLPKVNDFATLYRSVDMFISASVSEDCPDSVLEGMAAELAVAGPDSGGLREAVSPEQYAFLAPPDQPQLLADRIITLVSDPELRGSLGRLNRERVQTEFSVERMCERMWALINNNLTNGHSIEPSWSVSSQTEANA